MKPKPVHRRHQAALPSKVCPVCQRSFDWRKKWARVWATVKYCSERCRRAHHSNTGHRSSFVIPAQAGIQRID